MFQLEDSSCAKEVYFAIKLKETVGKINSITSADRRMSEHLAKLVTPREEILEKSMKLGLTAVAKAAAAGVASTTCTSLVDELLFSVSPPPVYEDDNGSSKVLMHEANDTDVLVIVDLSLTAASDINVCTHLMNLASEKIPLRFSKMTPRSSDIPSFLSFFQRMYDLLQQLLSMSSNTQSLNKADGLPAILTQCISPLNSASLAQHTGMLNKIKQLISELTIVLDFDHDAHQLTSSMRKSTDPKVTFKRLLYACSVSSDSKFFPIKNAGDVKMNYLLGLYDYLRQLTLVLKDCRQGASTFFCSCI